MTRYECTLNGMALGEISSDIIVLDVNEKTPEEDVTTYKKAFSDGLFFVRKQRRKTTVEIRFEIHNYDVQKRKMICQQVQKWANSGGVLMINDRPGQMLNVVCDRLPSITSALKWIEPLAVDFVAYENPYWESVSNSVSVSDGTAQFFVDGTAEKCKASVKITNMGSAAVTNVAIKTDLSSVAFDGISLKPGKTLETGYDKKGYFFAKIGQTSVIGNQIGDDEIWVNCGYSNVEAIASEPLSMSVSARGMWL